MKRKISLIFSPHFPLSLHHYLVLPFHSRQRLHSRTGRPGTLCSLLDDLRKTKWNIFPPSVSVRWKLYRRPPFFRLSLFVVDRLLANFHLLIFQPPEPHGRMFPNQAGVPLLSWHGERQGLFPHLSWAGGGGGGSLGLRAVRPILLRGRVVPIDSPRQITVIQSLGQLCEILVIKFSFT